MLANLENIAVATGLEKVSFHSSPQKGNAKEFSNYHTIALISNTSKVKLKTFGLCWGEVMTLDTQVLLVGSHHVNRPFKSVLWTGAKRGL